MNDYAALDLGRIAQDLQIRKVQVESVARLLDEGNTVPFITRYRKERTGGADEEIVRVIQKRVALQRQLTERKQTILKSIQAQGKLTDELQAAILACETSKHLEDLYLPYKPKKRSLATVAREHGLEPLALAIWTKDPTVANLTELLPTFVNLEKELPTPEDVLMGVQHILAEMIAETAEARHAARRVLWETGRLATAQNENLPNDQGLEYKDYFQFTEPVRHIPPHRILAINRGEKEGALRAKMEWHAPQLQDAVLHQLPLAGHPHADLLRRCALDALDRLLLPSLEREIRRDLTEEAEDHAVQVFSRNLRNLLLQPPIRGQRVLAIDPGFRTGCKLAVIDEIGNLLAEGVVFPHQVYGRRDKKGRPQASETKEPISGTGVSPAQSDTAGETPALPSPAPEEASVVPLPEVQQTSETVSACEQITQSPSQSVAQPPSAGGEAQPGAAVLQEESQLGIGSKEVPIAEPAPAPVAAGGAPAVSQKREESKARLEELVRTNGVQVVALGNGTACRETEELICELIAERLPELAYVIVNEAGASHYSTSPVGREEFPHFDPTVRGAISLGRRLQDPLSELVKIDPQNVGVGLYQHDLSQKRLKESLDAVIESCVNHVGVDLNTASVPLLRHVSGLNQLSARMVVEYRKEHGPFRSREQLKQVPNIGEATFTQAAGFLKVQGGDEPLDGTWIHPESYDVSRRLLTHLGLPPESLHDAAQANDLREKLKSLPAEEVCRGFDLGMPTLKDLVEALSRPGRDPREDLPKPVFKKGILKLEDLQPGMELKGTVLNVVDFGAFVDVGLKDSGLVHISQIANRYIKSPYEVVSVGDVVTVWVLKVDAERRRVSFTMIKPGTERKPPERRPAPPPRRQQGGPRRGQPAGTAQSGGAAQPQQGTQQAGVAVADRPPASRPPARPQRPAQPQRRERPKPVPKLSAEALEGAEPLRTFAELKALYDAKKPQ